MKPQKLLIIMSDEHNPKMLGGANHPLVQTPNLDRLAASGTRFANAYTNCPICVPARASFATGRYVHEIGCWDNAIAYDGRIEGWGHHLQQKGVRVESIGKLHYRNDTDPTGFDRQHIPMHIKDGVGMVHLSVRKQFPGFTKPPRDNGSGAASIVLSAGPGESEYTRYDRRVAELACDWLRAAARQDTPWVLFVSFVTPHFPLLAPDEIFNLYPAEDMPPAKLGPESGFVHHPWLDELVAGNGPGETTSDQRRTAFAAYLGLCSFMDAQVGRVLDALEISDLAASTRVIYTSDHGENAGARGMWGKSVHYEESSGIPLIIAGEDVPAGQVSLTPTTLIDAFPSVLQATGMPTPVENDRPGVSWFELAAATDEPERIAFGEYHAARSPSAAFMLRKGSYKYLHYVGFQPELFDLAADPEELTDLAGDPAYAATLATLERELRAIVDPEDVDRRANAAQKAMIESRGGPEAVWRQLVTTKHYTPVPDEISSTL